MKRLFALPIVVVLITASFVPAQVMCLYDSGDCWPGPTAADCNTSWGWVFNGGDQGKGTYCAGGTYDKDATTNRKNTPLPSANDVLLGCCYWAESKTYANVYTTKGESDCASGLNSYWKGTACGPAGADDNLTRPDGTPTFDGGSKTVYGYCKWAEDNLDGKCWPVTESSEAADCQGGANTFWGPGKEPPAGSGSGACPTATPDYDGSKAKYCDYGPITEFGGGCFALPNTPTAEADCEKDFGTVVEKCPGTGVRMVANKAAAPGVRVSYAKNRVTVNWTPSAKVASGTVQLLNAKGVAVSTAFIKANSSKVSVKLGTVGVPAGMYFVHINAVGQNGKKIVTNSAISIVK